MTYRERRERRAERLRGWAETRQERAATVLASHEKYRGDHAFNFQPGHIPERARVIAQADHAFESLRKADSMASRASGIEAQLAASIYDDDPDAIEQLTARIGRLEAERDRIKAFNATCRKGKPDPSLLTEEERRSLASTARVCAYSLSKGGGFPTYHLSNLNGNLNRQKQRLARLTRERNPRV